MILAQRIQGRAAVSGITGPGYGGRPLGQDAIVCDLH